MSESEVHSCEQAHAPASVLGQIAAYLAQVEQQCRTQGVRLTPLRREVLELVLSAQKPIGAYDLLARLGRDGRPAAPPTVYRSLDFLIEHGFIHRLASINAYLSCCHPAHRHQSVFLICTTCQRTDELSVASLAQPLQVLTAQQQFKVQQSLIEISGLCKNCQTQAGQTQTNQAEICQDNQHV